MTAKPVLPRERALRDIDEAVDYYLTEAGERVALGFIDALEQAFQTIGRHPAAASPRYAHELALPGLRSHLLKRYPYLVFYIERDGHVDIWRVLQEHRDIPARMRKPDNSLP